jgi:uncharacterized protein YceK
MITSLAFAAGCGTLDNLSSRNGEYYLATAEDCREISPAVLNHTCMPTGPFFKVPWILCWVADIPISLTTDTLLLPYDYLKRKQNGFYIQVSDDEGNPLSRVSIKGLGLRSVTGITDSRGMFRWPSDSVQEVTLSKSGYYDTKGLPDRHKLNTAELAGAKTNILNVILKEIRNPIPMYAKRLWETKIPAYGVPLGYDLVRGDWLPPYGRGVTSDFIFRLDCQFGGLRPIDNGQLFDATFALSFSNSGDGIQEVTQWPGSVLRLPRYAPSDGYERKWVEKGYRNENSSSGSQAKDYFFRVRTKKDDNGRIVSALYGKIQNSLHAEVVKSGSWLRLTYYLNPTPNDRNMEFDPKQNLMENTSQFEEVYEP